MKRKPILEAKWQGCANCSVTPEIILEDNDVIKSYDFMILTLNGKEIEINDNLTVDKFLENYNIKKKMKLRYFICQLSMMNYMS